MGGSVCEALGFEKLLSEEGFFARLLGRAPSGGGREPLYGPDLPVVLLTGGPGMGKERLLGAVRDRFATKVPVIYLHCGSPRYTDRAEPEQDARSAATELFADVAGRLCSWQGTGGSFTFPRLFAGLAVIATGVADGGPEAVATEVERYKELPQKQRLRLPGAGDFWRGVLSGTVHNLVAALAGQALDPYSAAVSNALLDALFEHLAPRGRAELERIYGAYPGAAGQPQHGLRNLAVDFQARGEARELAESFLFRALREDLEAAYASASGWLRRVGRPGLLLDHSETPLGEQLLRAVLTDRRGGQRDRVVIVGTARRADGGAFLHGGLPSQEVVPPAEFRPTDGGPPAWSRRRGPEAERAPLADGVLLLRMPFLTGDQLRRETERRQQHVEPEGGTNRRRIDAAVARLSGGRPHTVIRLAAAAAAFRMAADANDRDILDAPLRLPDDGAVERPVAQVLLQELVLEQLPVWLPAEHHDQWLDLLTHLSVAHDAECADVLLRDHQAGHVHRLTAHHVAQLLTDTGWPSCERHFIGDFGLRQMLVHRLYGLQKPDTCADGVERIDGECVGVNGAGYDFGTPEVGDVARAIAGENKRIEGQPHVTVAVMLPLQSDRAGLRRQMRSDLQGAYLGQREANKGEGEPPKIRLVLANPGRNYARQAEVVEALLRMADSSEDRLRAVTGFNLSLDATQAAVRRLTENGVPVLASRISGDGIANTEQADGMGKPRYPGLARIISTNHDAAQALANFNGDRGRRNVKTVLVYDKRPDSYNESLAKAFGGISEEGPAGPAPMPFESPAIDEPGSTGNQFTEIANNICDSDADTVYFAGRTLHLRIFALKLAQVGCNERHYTVVSGSDAASLQQDMTAKDWAQLRGEDGRAKVTVQYAAPAHPDAWRVELDGWRRQWDKDHDRPPAKADLPQYLTEPEAALSTLTKRIDTTRREGVKLGSTPSLEDSRTMLVYDGLVTIGTALHHAQKGGAQEVPGLADVGSQWQLLQSRHRVPGTSGLICLTSGGNAYDKPVAVVELDPGPQGHGRLKFVGLGWPTGAPQPKNCVIPGRTS